MKNIQKLVVFDWNGTLLDDTPVTVAGMNVILETFGRAPIDVVKFRECYDIPIARYYRSVGISDEEMTAHKQKMVDLFHDYYAAHAEDSPLVAGAAPLLRALKEIPVRTMILSNHIKTAITPFLDREKITDLFDAILAYESRAAQRDTNFFPNKGAKEQGKGDKLRLFLEKENIPPENAVILGDTPEETRIARGLGLRSIALTGGYANRLRLAEAAPDALLNTLDAVLPTLRAWGFVA